MFLTVIRGTSRTPQSTNRVAQNYWHFCIQTLVNADLELGIRRNGDRLEHGLWRFENCHSGIRAPSPLPSSIFYHQSSHSQAFPPTLHHSTTPGPEPPVKITITSKRVRLRLGRGRCVHGSVTGCHGSCHGSVLRKGPSLLICHGVTGLDPRGLGAGPNSKVGPFPDGSNGFERVSLNAEV
jgi:hypothetical protein